MTEIEQRARELLAAECWNFNPKERPQWPVGHTVNTEGALRAVEEALRLSAGADWVLVPREPTGDMQRAGLKAADAVHRGGDFPSACYTAMLAAAPRHEPGEGA